MPVLSGSQLSLPIRLAARTRCKTYAPVDIEAVRNTDAARLRGRRRMRAENENGDWRSGVERTDVAQPQSLLATGR